MGIQLHCFDSAKHLRQLLFKVISFIGSYVYSPSFLVYLVQHREVVISADDVPNLTWSFVHQYFTRSGSPYNHFLWVA